MRVCVFLSFFVRHFSFHVEFCILQLRLSDDIKRLAVYRFPGNSEPKNSERKIRSGNFGAGCFDLCRMYPTLTIGISRVAYGYFSMIKAICRSKVTKQILL